MSSSTFAPAIPLIDLPVGKMRAHRLNGHEIVICRARAGIFALDNVCTHAEARMSEGRLRGTRLICPLHGAAFDIRDGSVLAVPAELPLPAHAVRVVDGMIEVAISRTE